MKLLVLYVSQCPYHVNFLNFICYPQHVVCKLQFIVASRSERPSFVPVSYQGNLFDLPESLDIQGKVKLSLYLTKHHAMETYWGWPYSTTHSWPRH